MKTIFAATALLAVTACASTEAAPEPAAAFEVDGEGYFRVRVGDAGGLDAGKMGEAMAQGEIYCQQRGQTAETGYVTGPNGTFIRFRCVPAN